MPMIVRWPGHIEPGTVTDHIAYHGDFFATAPELTGARTIPDLDSISYVPTLLGEGEQPEHEYLYWEFLENTPVQAVRQGEWKALRFFGEETRVEVYNLAEDPGETADLSASTPDETPALVELMDAAHLPASNWPSAIDQAIETD